MTSQQELCTINIRVADDRFPRPYKVMAGAPTTDTTQSSNQLNKALTIRPLIRSPKPCTLCLVASPSQDIDLSVDPSSSQSVAYLFCVACNNWLCADHSNIHSRLTARLIKRSDHKVYTVDQYMNDSTIKQAIKQSIKQSPVFPLFPCTHHQLPLEHYCLKCKAYVCVHCIGMAQQSTRQSLCPLSSNHCDHSENHLQSLHDRWNDQIKELNVNPNITISLDQLQTQQNRVISSINHSESNALVNIHKAINQSIKTSVSSLVDQGIEKMTKQTHNLSQTIRSNLIHHKSKLIKSRQSVNQIVTQLNHQTRKLSFVEVGRSIRLLDQLLKECNKFNFKPKVRNLIVQSNHTPIRQSDEPTVMMNPSNDVRVDNPSTDRLSYGIDRTINTYSQTLQIILKNWMFVELVPLKLSVYPAYPLAKQQAQLEQPMSEASVSQSITESVSSSSEPKDETNSESSNNTDPGCDNCLFTHALNTPINHSTSVSHLEEDLFEPPALTWSNILSRIRALPSYGSLLDPAPTESIRFVSNVGEFADLLATQSICDDIRSLSFDQKLSLFQFEDVDITALMWFMATRLTTLSTYSQSCDTSALNLSTVDRKHFLLSGMALDYIHFPSLSEAMVNLAIFHLHDFSSLEFAHECRVRTVRLELEKKKYPDDGRSITSFIYPWRYRLNWAMNLFSCDPEQLQKQRDLAPLVVEASELAELLPYLKYVSSLKALIIADRLTDQQCQKLASILKFLPDLQNMDCRLGTVSKATSTGLLQSLAQFGRNLVKLTLRNCQVDNAPQIASAFSNMSALSVLTLQSTNEGIVAAWCSALPYLQHSLVSLCIDSCVLNAAACSTISSSLSHLHHVTRLSLIACVIQDCSESVKLMYTIGKCTKLQHFTLSGCKHASPNWGFVLVDALQNFPELQRLNISKTKEFVFNITSWISRYPSLVFLDISHVRGIDGAIIAQAMAAWPDLKVLRMHTTFCTNWSVAFTNLSSCPHLVELAITGVHLESTAVVSVGLQLLRLTNLKKFDMSDIEMDKKSGTILARNLQHLTALEYLDLSGNNVACVELRDSLRKMPRVRYLDISDIGLVGEQCKMFSDAFSPTHQIDHLDLSSNNLGRNGIKDMCDGLYHLRQIRWFSARRTGLDGTTEPCSRIVALLIRWARIATLDLSENKFGDEGIAIISTDMSTVFMREMEFENCSFGDWGMHALLARFPRLPVMRKINVTKNRISRLVCKRASEMTRSVQLRTDYNDL